MKQIRIILLVISIVGVLSGLTPEAWAGFAGPPCTVSNKPPGAVVIKGTVTIQASNPEGEPIAPGSKSIDYTWRLQRSQVLGFVRSHEIAPLSTEPVDLICLALGDATVRSDILSTFGLPPTLNLVLDSSISQSQVVSPDGSNVKFPAPATFSISIPVTVTCLSKSAVQVQVASQTFSVACRAGDVVGLLDVNGNPPAILFSLDRYSNVADITIYAVP